MQLCLLPTGGSPAAVWAETVAVYGWSPRGGWPSGPAPWCRRSAVHQNNAGSSGPPLALWPQSQNTTITLTGFIHPINSLKYGCTLFWSYFTSWVDIQLIISHMVPADSLMLKRTRAFMQRNSSCVTFSMQNLWESTFILTQCSYILDTCIRWLWERGGGTKTRERRKKEHKVRQREKWESQERVRQGEI